MLSYLLFALSLSLAPAAEHHNDQTSDTSRKLYRFATETQRSHAHFADVWPGFWSETTPFITYNNDGQAVLFTTDEPIAGYEKLADNYYYYADRLPNLNDFSFYIQYPLPNDQYATAIRLSDDESAIADHRDTLLHEAFHGYQRNSFADRGRAEFLDPKHLDETTHRALLALQLALAQQAHTSRELEDIHNWLIVRVALGKVITSEAADYLGDVERIEGTAHWVGIRSSFADEYRASMDSFFNNFAGHFESTHALRTSAYITGALLTDLVNDFSAEDALWRQAIEQGKTPFDLAIQTFAISTEDALARFNDILTQVNFSDYIAHVQTTESEVITLADIQASHPYRLDITVHVPMTDGRLELPMSFSGGDEGFHQLEVNLIFLPNAETFQLTLGDIAIDVRNAPVLADVRNIQGREVTYSIWSQSPLTTREDLRIMHDLELRFGQSIIRSPAGWKLDPDSTNQHLKITL
ncbi:MAG: hypothetical protein M1363_00705 [Gammaproteobacteria bacterium]|nr:hypothetical protein [Gammaproteobacteria bacterium]